MQKHIFKHHPAIMIQSLLNLVVQLLALAFGLIAASESINNSLDGFILSPMTTFLILMVIASLIIIYNYFIYKHSELIIDSQSITFEKNTFLQKTHKESNIQDVSNIYTSKNMLGRLTESTKLTIDINSSETANKADYSMILSDQDAQKFMLLYESFKKQEASINTLEPNNLDKDSAPHLQNTDNISYNYSPFEWIKHIILSQSIFPLVIFLTFVIIDITKDMNSIIFVVVFSVAVPLIKSINHFFNYSITRTEEVLSLSYGLTNRETFNMPMSNISSISIRQSLLAQLMGQRCVDVKTVGVGNEDTEKNTVILFGSKQKVHRQIKEFLPSFNLPLTLLKEPIIVRLVRSGIGVLLSLILLIFPYFRAHLLYYLPIPIIIVLLIMLSAHRYGYAFDGKTIAIKSGLFEVETKFIDITNVEYITLEYMRILTKSGLKKLQISYKDAAGYSSSMTGYYKLADYKELLTAFDNERSL